jgi:hypothetical protein
METLFQVLEQYRDSHGHHPAFQAGYVTGNPDYDRMKSEDFREYHPLFLPDFPMMWQRGEVIAKACEGMERGVWQPVFHGASHFNASRWLQRLATDADTRRSAEDGCFLGDGTSGDFEFGPETDRAFIHVLIREGLAAFRRSFGFAPAAAIFPAYYWPHEAEEVLVREGVTILHGKNCHICQQDAIERIRGKLYNLLGMKDSAKVWQIATGDYRPDIGLRYLARNVFFEPYLESSWHKRQPKETIAAAIAAVENAWDRGEPAVVITHRINYVGLHGETGRSLDCLDGLLRALTARYDVRFISDVEAAAVTPGDSRYAIMSAGIRRVSVADSGMC